MKFKVGDKVTVKKAGKRRDYFVEEKRNLIGTIKSQFLKGSVWVDFNDGTGEWGMFEEELELVPQEDIITTDSIMQSVDAQNTIQNLNVGGIKHDQDKPDLSLLSTIWVTGVGKVLTFGKKKYAAHNWRNGLEVSRVLAAALRHIFAFIGGEDLDPETGLPHLDHASCCLMFAREMWETRPELDDRFKKETK